MNVIKHIEDALEKGNSPYTIQDVLMANINGRLFLNVGKHMSSSYWENNGRMEVVHVGGTWNYADARVQIDAMIKEAKKRGIPWVWSGRKGWTRFLKKEGFKP